MCLEFGVQLTLFITFLMRSNSFSSLRFNACLDFWEIPYVLKTEDSKRYYIAFLYLSFL